MCPEGHACPNPLAPPTACPAGRTSPGGSAACTELCINCALAGVCLPGRAGHLCDRCTATVGFWNPLTCLDCVDEYWGPTCENKCPECLRGERCHAGILGTG